MIWVYMFCAMWEFAQSTDCVVQTKDPQNAYQSADCHCTEHIHTCRVYIIVTSVFDKLIWLTIGPKRFLFGTAQFSLWARWCS